MENSSSSFENEQLKIYDQKAGFFSSRLNRKGYLIGCGAILCMVIAIIIATPLMSRISKVDQSSYLILTISSIIYDFLLLGSLVYCIFFTVSISVRRVHDLGKLSFLKYFAWIPYLNLLLFPILALVEGEKGNNKYGYPNANNAFPLSTIFTSNKELTVKKDFPVWLLGDNVYSLFNGACYLYDSNLKQIECRHDIVFNLSLTNIGIVIFKRIIFGDQINSTFTTAEIKEKMIYKYIPYDEISDINQKDEFMVEIEMKDEEKFYLDLIEEVARLNYEYFGQSIITPIVSYFKTSAREGGTIEHFDVKYKTFLESIKPETVLQTNLKIMEKINTMLEDGESILHVITPPVRFKWMYYILFIISLLILAIPILGIITDSFFSKELSLYGSITLVGLIIMIPSVFSYTRKNSYVLFTNKRYFRIGRYGNFPKPVKYEDIKLVDTIKYTYTRYKTQRSLAQSKRLSFYLILSKSNSIIKTKFFRFLCYYDYSLITRLLIDLCLTK